MGSNFDDKIENRFTNLCELLPKPEVKALLIGPVTYLGKLLTTGRLHNIEFDRNEEPTRPYQGSDGSVPSMEISENAQRCVYRISQRTRDAMQRVVSNNNLDNQATDWMIDNYFIHELLHYAQGMAGGNHSGLSQQAPQVLLAIDYQADALAAITSTILAWCYPTRFGLETTNSENHWTLYVKAIQAILHQMEIFTLMFLKDMDRQKISQRKFPLERIQRIATWHYQFHRAERFLQDHPIADFQILAQPILDFRNLAWAASFLPDALCRNWPEVEIEKLKSQPIQAPMENKMYEAHEREPLIITGVTQNGTTQFLRHSPATHTQYRLVFEGIFDNNVRASRDFFTTLLDQHDWLIRYDTQPVQKLRRLTNGLAQNNDVNKRLEILMSVLRPSQFPLVNFSA